ncbi:MAG: glycosyltransferase family 4 protein [Bacteroidales bacterium]
MRILIIANYKPDLGGISGQVELLSRNLLNEGHIVRIFSTKKSIIQRLWLIFSLAFAGRKYEIFHIHACSDWGFFPAVLGVMVGKLQRKKIILTYHGGKAESFFDHHPQLVRYFLCKTDANIVLSVFLAKIFDMHKIPYHIIPNILEFKDHILKKRTTINPRFISTRTLTPTYNIGCIIKAFEMVQQQIPSSELYIVGEGSSRNELEEMVRQKKLKNIHFCGRVKNCEIYSYLEKADIFISSPIVDNQPMSILEAFNAGLLVISSHVGGIPYLIEDGVTGYLFESDNEKQLADCMIKAIQDEKHSIEMIKNGNKELIKYQWQYIRNKIYSIYFTI